MKEIVSVAMLVNGAQFAKNINMNNVLMAMLDGWKPTPLTRWERFKLAARRPFWRIRDAWLVLIGRADISDPYDD